MTTSGSKTLEMIPCYVSGKGMYATGTTWEFKTAVIAAIEAEGIGYDTRYRYYQRQFPQMLPGELARLVCDPIEYYDKEWPAYLAGVPAGTTEAEAATRFMLERDRGFQSEAKVAIYCFDEAGFGSGVNCMRFLNAGKPILGFYNSALLGSEVNLSNFLQLRLDYPKLVTLVEYAEVDQISAKVCDWLRGIAGHRAGP